MKPFNANHGRGITIHLTTADEVRPAFEVAREHSRSVIVESFITGDDHRMLVIDGQLVAVSKRVPGHVVGDGTRTIEQLVEEVNQDPRRGIGHEKVLTRLTFDHQAETMLAAEGLHPGVGARRRASGCSSAPPATSPPAAPPPTSPTWCIPTTPRWRPAR